VPLRDPLRRSDVEQLYSFTVIEAAREVGGGDER